jgi:TPR repeat protein
MRSIRVHARFSLAMRSVAAILLTALILPQPAAAENFSSGTGFFVTADGYIATNNHVIDGADKITVRDIRGREYPAEYVRSDLANDLAIIKVKGDFKPLPIARSSGMRRGDSVFALGFPQPDLQGLSIKMTEGSISSLTGLQDEPNNFQISVPLQHGNSGGPLLNAEGQIVGVVVAKLAPRTVHDVSEIPEVVNYAVKSNYLLELIGTDVNISEQVKIVSPVKPKGRPASMADVVAKAEPSVVLIITRIPDRKNGTQSDRSQPPNKGAPPDKGQPASNVPRYDRDAAALLAFQNGLAAKKAQKWPEALHYFGRAAELGYAAAQFELGSLYSNGQGVSRDDTEAVRWYRKAADQNNVGGQLGLAAAYESGRGVQKDEVEALRWLRKAADQGHAGAQASVGYYYAYGRGGLTKDDAEAVRWYRLAVNQGNVAGQNSLGIMLANGRGIAKDDVEATRMYRLAADQGYALGQANLGTRYAMGLGVAKDEAAAVAWYTRAAEKGNSVGQFLLGEAFEYGHGVAKDDRQADSWYRKSAAQNFQGAIDALKRRENGGAGQGVSGATSRSNN